MKIKKRQLVKKRRTRSILPVLLMMTACVVFSEIQGRNESDQGHTLPNANTRQNNTPMSNTIKITVGSSTFTAVLADNAAAAAFKALLPLTVGMNDVNGNEKYYRTPKPLPTAATPAGSIRAGDLMLWGEDGLVLFYKSFSSSYSYTRLGRVDDAAGLASALGAGKATVTFELK